MIDLAGQRFGRLVVLHRVPSKAPGRARWAVLCDCGTASEAITGNLRSGQVQSCGCLTRERTSATNTTHGQSSNPEYKIMHAAKQRCANPSAPDYERYGGRGIAFNFSDFAQFFAEVGPRPSNKHSLDRIDNAKGYEPGNVQWATVKEQTRNTRSNRMLTFQGKTQCLAAWAEELGLPCSTIKSRLKLGWSIEKALTTAGRSQKKPG